ncbi:MAG: trimethylamine methyltransferase family protein [Bacillota bacterium]|jgi:trimethylamine--corrinoid protein Co-methyltransferase
MTSKSLYVRANYQVNQTPQFRMLSNDQCEEIYLSALEILERTGVTVENKELLELYGDKNCWIDGNRVRFPAYLVQWALRTAPCRVVLSNREGKRSLFLEANNIYYGTGAYTKFVLDLDTGERREATAEDHEKTARLSDGLSNIDFLTGCLADLVKYTSKPVIHNFSDLDDGQKMVEIGAAVAGGLSALQQKPFFSFHVESASPLLPGDTWDKVKFAAQNRIPLIYSSNALAGSEAPVTLSGYLALILADSLAALITSQLVNEGAPFILGVSMGLEGQEEGVKSVGAPEHSLISAGLANISRYLNIPSFITGGMTDAKTFDAQASIETAFSLLAGGLIGPNLVAGCNILEFGNTSSLDLLVMNDEIIGMVKRILRGIDVNDDTLAVDAIDEVGPGGHFLGSEHTMRYFRKETWWPTIINRLRHADWVKAGEKTFAQKAKEKAARVLGNHQPEPLPEAVLEKISAILS